MLNIFKDKFPKVKFNKLEKDEALISLEHSLKKSIKDKFSSKLKLFILDSGSCNGCELELQLLFSPNYDLSVLGVEVVYESAKADILLVTGLMTQNIYPYVQKIYKSLKVPKHVILIGDCPIFSGPFQQTFALTDNVNSLFSSAYHLKGCPPEPKDILFALDEYLKKIKI